MFSVGDRFDLHIDRLSVGGRGVGRQDGIVVFVDLVAPGEDVEVEILHIKKNLIEAKLIRIIKPSDERIDPPCLHFKEGCGGCSWQHINYKTQLLAKRELVSEALQKFSGFTGFKVENTVASPLTVRYRNRIQVHLDRSSNKNPKIGFHARGSHKVIDIKDCLITEEALVEKLIELREKETSNNSPASHSLQAQGHRIQIYRNQQNQILVENAEEQSTLAFSQVNSSQNEQLIKAVINQARMFSKPSTILDLYSGSGNFTFPLSQEFISSQVTGVELNSPAVQLGNQKARQASSLVRFERAKVEEYLKRWKPPGGQYLILIDPPRVGCDRKAIEVLKKLKPTCLIYVSCHPVTLARDLKSFAESGWKLNFIQPFDMFPQTDHVEILVTLVPPTEF